MRKALILLLALTAGGCAMPQTTQELRDVYKRQGTAANIDKYAVNRPFAAAFADVKANADQCLNVRVTGGTFDGGVYYPDSATWHSFSKKTSERTAEVTLQLDKRIGTPSTRPEGGWYMMVADLEATAANKTDLTIYHPSAPAAYGNISRAMAAWADGKKAPCPKVP